MGGLLVVGVGGFGGMMGDGGWVTGGSGYFGNVKGSGWERISGWKGRGKDTSATRWGEKSINTDGKEHGQEIMIDFWLMFRRLYHVHL